MFHREIFRFRFLALGLPTAITVFGILYGLAELPMLPNQIASHFGADGQANDYSSPLAFIAGIGALQLALVVFIGYLAGTVNRLIVVVNNAFALFFSWGVLGLTIHRNVAASGDVTQATLPWLPMLAILGCSIGVGIVLGLFAKPVYPAEDGVSRNVDKTLVADHSTTQWVGTARMPAVIIAVLLLSLAALATITVYLFLDEDASTATKVILGGATLLMLPTLAMTKLTVTVNQDQVTVAFLAGLFRSTTAVAAITAVQTQHINPMSYGGWGLRFSKHGMGYILRSGEGMTLHRANQTPLVVTVDEAQQGAAIVQGLIERNAK
ncbi:DUF1648 domain-containing protein [Corynebacterium choanae]|uniref:DUF1648 domain-containing protein n=1 Tax=Corynebacterium choanae TaxID=1862358 RepID=A0A3G6J7B9_9CORY|nr:DUF1648 domain-containing protein [Corynebacterium choanae]AZA13876.1 hypothetical protein CCHOA_07420 [Corynebacterium choanae]